MKSNIKFSVVLPVHINANPKHFDLAIRSILSQSVKPNELIIVADGPISSEVQTIINKLKNISNIRVIYSEVNVGMGVSRDIAIEAARYEYIALMDSDDISVSDRFEKQINVFDKNKVDVVGGWIEDFEAQIGDLKYLRKVPKLHSEIYNFGKWRMPVNNVTIMFKKILLTIWRVHKAETTRRLESNNQNVGKWCNIL